VLVDAFEEAALVLGGLFAVHEVEDEVIWRAMKGLIVIYRKARNAIRDSEPGRPSDSRGGEPKPHPAVVEFLTQIQRDRKAPRREKVGSR
jgi:hypothetical protein